MPVRGTKSREYGSTEAGGSRMFRRSGYRFADKNMRQSMILEHVPIPKERDML